MRSPLLGIAILFGVGASATPASAHDFLGAESCQSCHPEAWSAWKSSSHARAKEVLSAPQQKDARCLSCHSPAETEQKVAGVSCESCHGGGQYYSAKFVMKDAELSRLVGLVDPSEKQCRSCHDGSTPSIKPFEFAPKLKAMDHWSLERAKKQKASFERPAEPSKVTEKLTMNGKR